jgi:hypothetical protein
MLKSNPQKVDRQLKEIQGSIEKNQENMLDERRYYPFRKTIRMCNESSNWMDDFEHSHREIQSLEILLE